MMMALTQYLDSIPNVAQIIRLRAHRVTVLVKRHVEPKPDYMGEVSRFVTLEEYEAAVRAALITPAY